MNIDRLLTVTAYSCGIGLVLMHLLWIMIWTPGQLITWDIVVEIYRVSNVPWYLLAAFYACQMLLIGLGLLQASIRRMKGGGTAMSRVYVNLAVNAAAALCSLLLFSGPYYDFPHNDFMIAAFLLALPSLWAVFLWLKTERSSHLRLLLGLVPVGGLANISVLTYYAMGLAKFK